jgi:hypothetical protein
MHFETVSAGENVVSLGELFINRAATVVRCL